MGIKNWDKKPLKHLCLRIGDGLHGTPEYVDEGEIYFINGNNLKNGTIEITPDTKKVSTAVLESNFISLNSNSLLLSINGTLGSMAFYNNETIMLGKSAAYLNFKTGINRFFYYYFQLKDVQNYFYNVATGSTIKNLGLKSIQDFEVPIPEENEWISIAKVLSDLDTKIEINNKINTELEAMAKLIYDYWFVQFEFPFDFAQGKPKPDIKPYKSSGGKMVWNEELKREVPAGWEVNLLTEEMDLQYGFPFSTKKFNTDNNGVPVVRIRDIQNCTISNYSTEEVDMKYKLNKGDLIVGMDGNFHMNYWTKENCYLNQRCLRIRSTETSISEIQARYQTEPFIKAREKNVSRTTVAHLSARDINELRILKATKDLQSKANSFFESILNKLTTNNQENQKLAELRDWLLPMLMNGQVKVSSQEEILNIAAEPEVKYGNE